MLADITIVRGPTVSDKHDYLSLHVLYLNLTSPLLLTTSVCLRASMYVRTGHSPCLFSSLGEGGQGYKRGQTSIRCKDLLCRRKGTATLIKAAAAQAAYKQLFKQA